MKILLTTEIIIFVFSDNNILAVSQDHFSTFWLFAIAFARSRSLCGCFIRINFPHSESIVVVTKFNHSNQRTKFKTNKIVNKINSSIAIKCVCVIPIWFFMASLFLWIECEYLCVWPINKSNDHCSLTSIKFGHRAMVNSWFLSILNIEN